MNNNLLAHSTYNYSELTFDALDVWLNSVVSPPLGRPAPDFRLYRLDDRETWLSQIWAEHSYTVVEFGSMTCPACKLHAAAMEELARRYNDSGVGFVFVYTRETHPGEVISHLTSLVQKFCHARLFRERLRITRPILVDTLDGACHRAYGALPNMTWIFNQTGVAFYKSTWTDVNSIGHALNYFLGVVRRQRAGEYLRPFLVEMAAFETYDAEAVQQALRENGAKALEDYQEAVRDYLAYVP
jgi:thiol-disulfide isomerase/thioredoxin